MNEALAYGLVDALSGAMPNSAYLMEVGLRDLSVFADIGICPHEVGQPQLLKIDVILRVIPPDQDNIDEAMDYSRIVALAEGLAKERIALIETFARRLAEACLQHPFVLHADVKVDKPGALPTAIATTRVVQSGRRAS